MAPSKTVTAVQAADLEDIIDLVVASKNALTISMLLVKDYPNPSARRQTTEPAVRGSFDDPACMNLKVVDDRTGELLGCLTFKRSTTPGVKPEIAGNEAGKPASIPEFFNADVLNMVMEGVGRISASMAGRDFIEIIFLAVKQSHKRQGIGRTLMQAAMDRAVEEGIPVAAQSEPAAYQFFKSLGFTDTVGADFDLAQFAPPNSGFGNFRLQGMIKE